MLVLISPALRQPPIAVLLAALALAVGIGACGGGGGDDDAQATEDPRAVLAEAFGKPIPSADVTIDAQLDIAGVSGLEDPLRIRARGPYVRAERRLPELDLDLSLEAQGAGQAIEAGVLSTGDRIFLKFGGVFYEQPHEQVARANRQLARQRGDGGSFADLGIDAGKWVLDARFDGEEEIGGVAVRHVTGTLDVAAALRDLNGLVRRSAGTLGEAGERARPLRPGEIERLSDAVEQPSFDAYVGVEDGIVRRLTLRLDVAVPEEDRADVGGASGAAVRLSVQFDDVGGDQTVEAPRSSRPLSELVSQIGGLDALTGGWSGGDGPALLDGALAPDEEGGGALDDFERYAACLDDATPDDAAAIELCRALLP